MAYSQPILLFKQFFLWDKKGGAISKIDHETIGSRKMRFGYFPAVFSRVNATIIKLTKGL